MKEITLMCLVASLMIIDIGCKKEDPKLTPQPISKEKSSSISQNQPTKSLHRAAAEGDIKQVELQLANGAYINATDVSGSTPLHLAVSHGHNNIVELLIAEGVDIDATDNRSNIPLHCAARGGYTSLAQLLIAKGADVNARNYIGATPLYLAATHGHKDMVEFLISHVSDVNIRTYGNITPLSSAKKQGHTEIVELLQEHGAKLETELVPNFAKEIHSGEKLKREALERGGSDTAESYYTSEGGRFSIPLKGGTEIWLHRSKPGQEHFFRTEAGTVQTIMVQWVARLQGVTLSNSLALFKAVITSNGGILREGSQRSIQLDGRAAIKFEYEEHLIGSMYSVCVILQSASNEYTITAVSRGSYSEAERLFNDVCMKIRFND